MTPDVPITKDLVLLGGGHAHLFVLEAFRMRPMPGVRLTLLTRDVLTPYSGMLPGTLAGHYSQDESHIDLRPLAIAAGARIFHDEATGIDRAAKQVLCANRPPIPYDVLSIDVGSRPRISDVPGAAEHAIPLKPIDRLAARWDALVARVRTAPLPCRVAVVGGGAAGVEVALATQYRLRAELVAAGRDPDGIVVTLVSKGGLLVSHSPKVGRVFARVLAERRIAVHANRAVVRVEKDLLHLEGGTTLAFDEALWATEAGTLPWLAASGLDCNAGGFVLVDETLRSTNDPSIFAAGDAADMVASPRPKAGVFAVRQGPPLARNLREAIAGRPLERFVPQKRFLSILSTGDRYAVASKGAFSTEGAWVWRWKDRLDRRFMERFRVAPMMAAPAGDDAHDPMRCGGCGAKVGSSVLSRVLARLAKDGFGPADGVVVGLDAPDDAAVLRPPDGKKLLVQTVDFFRAFVEDPYLFGRIAAVHALGDLHAMGATPRSALAIVTVPHGPDEKIEDSLYQMMAGALSIFRAEGLALVGGHSAEGGECALGFSLEGVADEAALLRKSTLRAGDVLVLTKPLGTGVLFAADMRRLAKGRWIDGALASMQRSSREPAAIAIRHGATACTDVTGFGLAGHLLEMLKPGGLAAEIDLSQVPILDGAVEMSAAGVTSTLYPANARAAGAFRAPVDTRDPRWPLLFDPQTAGGLLAALPADRADACVHALREAGERAAIIARVLPDGGTEPLRLR